MKVVSFIRHGYDLAPVEVELTLSPGLPQFHFLGLRDAALKESALRIRSALREQGFQVPPAQQVLIHMRPTHLRKSSRGLDLAIAMALLWETAQVPKPEEGIAPCLYGELTLTGEVLQPDDIDGVPLTQREPVYTGVDERPLLIESLQAADLKTFADPTSLLRVRAQTSIGKWIRPRVITRAFPKPAAEIAKVAAAGEHSLLLAGPPGGGKSTLADAIPAWLEAPDDIDTLDVKRLWRQSGEELRWRPTLKPHHSITPLAMIGGGVSLWPGEITRAHTGVLIMDELLEFHPDIQESLREPVESGTISLVRAGRSKTYSARILLIATSNLCPCGNFVPKRTSRKCRCTRVRRSRTLTRLTGPFVDRFALVALTDEWDGQPEVSSDEIASEVKRAIEFRKARGQSVPNSRILVEPIEEKLTPYQRDDLLPQFARSRRRHASILRVARTLADLRTSDAISDEDLESAARLSSRVHRQLEEWCD